MLSTAAILSSCSGSETTKELRIAKVCTPGNDLCKFELTDAVVDRDTNLIGKTIERIVSSKPLEITEGNIVWSGGVSVANNDEVTTHFGQGCENGQCSRNSNPTALYFLPNNSTTVKVTGIVTVDG